MKCYKCKCKSCINNTSNLIKIEEFNRKKGITCFNCEECYLYGHEATKINNYKKKCLKYIKSDRDIENERQGIDIRAVSQRKLFKIIENINLDKLEDEGI